MSITSFTGQYRFLSNFATSNFEYQNTTWNNAEAAFQAMKCPNRINEFSSLPPNEAKALGRRVSLRKDWEQVKESIMHEIVYAKFSQDPHLLKRLLQTQDQTLVEGNHWHDNIWGNCSCHKCKKIKGQNKLGKILMRVRGNLSFSKQL